MMLYKREHLTQNELTSIKKLTAGEFNEKTLQKLVTKLSSNFEQYKSDKAILQYLSDHTRQLGLDQPSFANPKDKNNCHLLKRSILKVIALIKSASKQTLLISNRNLKTSNRNHVTLITIKRKRERFPLATNVAILLASKGAHTPIIDTKTVDSKMVNNQHPSIQT